MPRGMPSGARQPGAGGSPNKPNPQWPFWPTLQDQPPPGGSGGSFPSGGTIQLAAHRDGHRIGVRSYRNITLVAASAVALAAPTQTHLAAQLRHTPVVSRRTVPAVVAPPAPVINFRGRIALAAAPSRTAKARLRPPAVINPAAAAINFRGRTTLAAAPTRTAKSSRQPTVSSSTAQSFLVGVATNLFSGKPIPRTGLWHYRDPALIAPTPAQTFPVGISSFLVKGKPQQAKPLVRRAPVVVTAATPPTQTQLTPAVRLTRWPWGRQATRYLLRAPAVVNPPAAPVSAQLAIWLTRRPWRGQTRYLLRPPTVVGAAAPPTLAQMTLTVKYAKWPWRRQATRYILQPPTIINPFVPPTVTVLAGTDWAAEQATWG